MPNPQRGCPAAVATALVSPNCHQLVPMKHTDGQRFALKRVRLPQYFHYQMIQNAFAFH
jgi:hypothetical protein